MINLIKQKEYVGGGGKPSVDANLYSFPHSGGREQGSTGGGDAGSINCLSKKRGGGRRGED